MIPMMIVTINTITIIVVAIDIALIQILLS